MRRFWFRHPEWRLAGFALLAWVAVLLGAGGHAHTFWERQSEWLLMLATMMIPPALPMARHVIQNSMRHRRQRAGFLFAGSSLMYWLAGGVGVGLASWTGAADYRRWLLGGSLLVAAAWELTPAKRRALKACHRTIPLPPDGRKADRACVKLGAMYGRACFRACWALMLPMVLVGHVGVFLMLLLTGVAVVEEVKDKGYRLAPAAAVLLTVAGTMVLVLG
ncbi:MAG: DUF2182 domain-containing protein [Actinomycetota bacterium]